MTFKEVLKNAPSVREMRFGEFGLMIADLETKTVHVSNLNTSVYPNRFDSKTTQNFGEFVAACNDIIGDDEDLQKVMNAGLLVYQGHFNGTF